MGYLINIKIFILRGKLFLLTAKTVKGIPKRKQGANGDGFLCFHREFINRLERTSLKEQS